MTEICARCGEEGQNRRIITMACGYDLMGTGIPFFIETKLGIKFCKLIVCKECRADWILSLENWWKDNKSVRSCGSGIWIREHGALKEVTEEEFYKRQKDILNES